MNPETSSEALVKQFEQAGQGQVFQFLEELNAEEKGALLAQAATIDLAEVDMLVKEHVLATDHAQLDLTV